MLAILSFLLGLLAFSPAFGAGAVKAGAPVTYNYNTSHATPWMAVGQWYQIGTSTQAYGEAMSDALVSTGLLAAGYNIVKADVWSSGARNSAGILQPNANFTDMKAFADYIKANGESPMMYTDGGSTGCSWPGGSEGHFLEDFTTFLVTWGYQGIMLDSCGMYAEGLDPRVVSEKAFNAINQIGVPAFLELGPASYGAQSGTFEFGPLWGTDWWAYSDVFSPGCNATYSEVLSTFWASNAHAGTTGPYHYVRASALMTNSAGLTTAEQQAQFAFWTILSSALEIGCDMRSFSAPQLAMLKNATAIGINQDPWVLSPMRMNYPYTNSTEVYAKWLSTTGSRAVLLSNEDGAAAHDITVNFSDIGLTGTASVYDILNQTSLGTASTSYTATAVPANSVVYLKLTGATENNYNCYAIGAGQTGTNAGTNCTWQIDNNGQYGAGGFTDGGTQSVATAITTTGVTNPAPQTIYQHARVATAYPVGSQCPMSYNFWNLVPGATYKIRLHFSDNWSTGAGQRQFNVNLYNGVTNTQVLTNFDIFATAGGQFKANVQEFLEPAPHGSVAIIFSEGAAGCPMINGMEAIKQ
jgi:hypothetical protein